MIKNDEKRFLIDVWQGEMVDKHPRDIINQPDFYMPHKRAWYLLGKWSKKRWYNYGVALDLGWLEKSGKLTAEMWRDEKRKGPGVYFYEISTGEYDDSRETLLWSREKMEIGAFEALCNHILDQVKSSKTEDHRVFIHNPLIETLCKNHGFSICIPREEFCTDDDYI